MIKVMNEKQNNQYSDPEDMKTDNAKLWYSIIKYAKEHRGEYEYIKIGNPSILIKSSHNDGIFDVRRSSNKSKTGINVYLDGNKCCVINSLDDYIKFLKKTVIE